MQVTQQATHLTHAVIGAGEQLSFGVSDDPMFFHMLYSSLYGNPMRAAFREPLCNAWDANIEAGKEDVPLEITLTESQVTIKDAGFGIPHDKISKIYLTLGKSTKVQQADQTGGFGLGCKAPFAYAEHFEVRSAHNGICTIYRLIKVCPEKGGRPGATVIASFPTKETGLTVTIPFTITGHDESGQPRSSDYQKIKRYIMEAISQGGMLAKVNGVLVPTIPLSREPGSWIMSQAMNLANNTNHRVFVRYGSVVYPVEQMEGLDHFRDVFNALRDCFGHNSSMEIVFQAPPDSIVIPPNREAISSHPKTVATLNGLMEGVLLDYEKSQKVVPKREYQTTIHNLANSKPMSFYDYMRASLKNWMDAGNFMDISGSINPGVVLTNTDAAVKAQLFRRDSPFSNHSARLLTARLRIKAMAKEGFITHQMAKLLNHREFAHMGSWYDYDAWATKHIIKPMLRRLIRGGLNHKHFTIHKSYGSNVRDFMQPWTNHYLNSHDSVLYAARKVLVMSYNKTDAFECGGQDHKMLKQHAGGNSCVMIYMCPKGNGCAAKAREVFGKMRDIHFVDLTLERDERAAQDKAHRASQAAAKRAEIARLKAEGKPLPEPEAKKEVEKLPGFPSLRNAWDGCDLNFRAVKLNSEHRVLKPLFWFQKPEFRPRQHASRIGENVTSSDSQGIIKPYLDYGIMPTNKVMEKYIADNNLPEFKEFLMQQMERHLGNCKQMQQRMGMKISRVRNSVMGNSEGILAPHKTAIMKLIMGDSWLRQHYGIKRSRISYSVDSQIHALNRLNTSNYLTGADLQRMKDLYAKVHIPDVQQATKDLFVLVSSNPYLRYLDSERLENHLENKDKGVRMATRHFIIETLNKK